MLSRRPNSSDAPSAFRSLHGWGADEEGEDGTEPFDDNDTESGSVLSSGGAEARRAIQSRFQQLLGDDRNINTEEHNTGAGSFRHAYGVESGREFGVEPLTTDAAYRAGDAVIRLDSQEKIFRKRPFLRGDGRALDSQAQKNGNFKQFSRDWMKESAARQDLVEEDDRMRFLRLVAGFSNEDVENYYTYDDSSNEAEARLDRAHKRRIIERSAEYKQQNLSTMLKVILESMQLQLGSVNQDQSGGSADRIVVLNRDVFERMASAMRAENVDMDWAESNRMWENVKNMASKPVGLREFFTELQKVAAESFKEVEKEQEASLRTYTNRRQWMEMPQNSGMLNLRPNITAAIAAAESRIQLLAGKSSASAEDLMRDGPHQTMFAQLVAVQVALIRTGHPTRYLPPALYRMKMEEQRRLMMYFHTRYFPLSAANAAAATVHFI